TSNVRLSGQLIWQDWTGRAGVQFLDVPKTSRRLLTDYLAANIPHESNRQQFSEVTVEMEELLQLSTAAVAEQTHGTRRAPETSHYAVAPQAATTEPSDADNRRTQARYACRLGAEVYRSGTSVPNHCCLTD